MSPLPTAREVVAWLGRAPVLTGLGLIGLAAGAGCLLAAVLRGATVAPEGDLIETAIFNGSVGVFLLTMAALVPLASFGRRGYRIWLATLIVVMPYNYGIETVQAFRGYDPRFSEVAPPIDQLLGGLFFGAAMTLLVCFSILAAKLWRVGSSPLLIAIRYGAVASLGAFGVGILMSALGGRVVPAEGNLLPLHALGFHGLQAVPLVALVMRRRGLPDEAARGWVHVAGLAWLGVCLGVAAQTALGRPLTEIAPATVAALGLLLAWAATLLVALRARPRES